MVKLLKILDRAEGPCTVYLIETPEGFVVFIVNRGGERMVVVEH